MLKFTSMVMATALFAAQADARQKWIKAWCTVPEDLAEDAVQGGLWMWQKIRRNNLSRISRSKVTTPTSTAPNGEMLPTTCTSACSLTASAPLPSKIPLTSTLKTGSTQIVDGSMDRLKSGPSQTKPSVTTSISETGRASLPASSPTTTTSSFAARSP